MRSLPIVLSTLVILASGAGHAEPHVAVGASGSWQQRQDFGAGTRASFAPELVAYAYLGEVAPRVWLRPGARVGFVGLEQAEMPGAIRVREHDLTSALELAALYDGVVVPSLGVGAGLVTRWLSVETRAPIEGGERSDVELMPAFHAQLGLGLPFGRSGLALEPFVRFEHVLGDDRLGWRFGADFTLGLF